MYLYALHIWYVLYALIGIDRYWNVLMCISKCSYSNALVCIVYNGLYLYILISICVYGIYCFVLTGICLY